MNINVFNAVAALLEADATLTTQNKEKILEVCKHPNDFSKPEEKRLPRLLTIKEAAACLHVSRCTLWRMTAAGEIQAIRFRVDGNPRYRFDDIQNLIDKATPVSCGGVKEKEHYPIAETDAQNPRKTPVNMN